MTYEEVLKYLFEELPMYQQQGKTAFKADLSNIIQFCEALGNPHLKFKSVHIAGTNGKGSTAHGMASVLQEAGYRTGLYTSPHLKDYRERIRINGEMISQDAVVDFVTAQRSSIDEIHPSFFEFTVALAFHHFAEQQVDIAVIETGLGGRLDSTNIVTPEISVITSIGLDHTHILGDTVVKIAGEKAGIIKNGVPVVLPKELPKGTREVFTEKADTLQAPVNQETQSYKLELSGQMVNCFKDGNVILTGLRPGIKGRHFLKNLPTVIESVMELRKLHYQMTDDQLKTGIERIVENTGLKGRWQQLAHQPDVIADVGHNPDGWSELLGQIAAGNYGSIHFVIGMVNDKAVEEILDLLPFNALYYLCEPKIPRAMPVEQLAASVRKAGFSYTVVKDVNECIDRARRWLLQKT